MVVRLLIDLDGDYLRRLRLVPVQTRAWPISVATGGIADAIADLMVALCRPIGAAAPVRTADGLELDLAK